MGNGLWYKCPKCGFEFIASFGVGYMFPMEYAEAVHQAKAGELGEEIQNFFNEHTDGAIDAEHVVLCCEDCGHFREGMDLTMYIPNEKKPEKPEHGRWSVSCPFEGAHYVSWSDLEEYYTKYAEYPHICDKCGGRMKIMHEGDDMNLLCPKCRTPLEQSGIYIKWD